VRLRVTGGYGLLMRLAHPIVTRQIKRSLEADLRQLGGRLEAKARNREAPRSAGGER
jgi:hypothetical protein